MVRLRGGGFEAHRFVGHVGSRNGSSAIGERLIAQCPGCGTSRYLRALVQGLGYIAGTVVLRVVQMVL